MEAKRTNNMSNGRFTPRPKDTSFINLLGSLLPRFLPYGIDEIDWVLHVLRDISAEDRALVTTIRSIPSERWTVIYEGACGGFHTQSDNGKRIVLTVVLAMGEHHNTLLSSFYANASDTSGVINKEDNTPPQDYRLINQYLVRIDGEQYPSATPMLFSECLSYGGPHLSTANPPGS